MQKSKKKQKQNSKRNKTNTNFYPISLLNKLKFTKANETILEYRKLWGDRT